MANYSPKRYTGDGSTKDFTVPWNYLSTSHVTVEVDGVSKPFTWVNDSTLRMNTAPGNGTSIIIYRNSGGTADITFAPGPILSTDLNYSYKHALYRADEAVVTKTISRVGSNISTTNTDGDQVVEKFYSTNTNYALIQTKAEGSSSAITFGQYMEKFVVRYEGSNQIEIGSNQVNIVNGDLTINGSLVAASDGALYLASFAYGSLPSYLGPTMYTGPLAFSTNVGSSGSTGAPVARINGVWVPLLPGYGIRVNSGDANFNFTPITDSPSVRLTGTITANRTVTLQTTNAYPGYRARFTRTGGGAFTWSIGGLKSLSNNQWCDVEYDGTSWVLSAYGTL
jgi:hypothetical protein